MDTTRTTTVEIEPSSTGTRAAEPPRSAASDELDALFRLLVERAHDAVDRLAERAAPAVGQLTAGLALVGDLSGDQKDTRAGDGSNLIAALPVESAEELVERCYSVVRQHPVASLAAAVAAGIVLAQIRTR